MAEARRELSKHMVWWPVAVAIVAGVVAGARADTQITAHDARLTAVESTTRINAERLARVEQMAADIQATTHRVEQRLDRKP